SKGQTYRDASGHQPQMVAKHEARDLCARRAERQADADLVSATHGEIRDDAVQPDGHERHGEDAKGGRDPRDHPFANEALANLGLQLDKLDHDGWVEACDPLPDGGGDPGQSRAGADNHWSPRVRTRILCDWHVRNRGHRPAGHVTPAILFSQIRVLRVTDDADDFVSRLREPRFRNRTNRRAKRTQSAQVTSNEAFVDQHHASGAGIVERGEITARPYRDLQRVEVPWADVRESRRLAFVPRHARDAK